jgi:Restriction endonuclease
MQEPKSTWELFEDLVRRILEANNFQVKRNALRGDRGFDLLGTLENERWAIEVKYYRTVRAQPTLVAAAATRLVNNGITAQALKGMLVVSCILPHLTTRSRPHMALLDVFKV